MNRRHATGHILGFLKRSYRTLLTCLFFSLSPQAAWSQVCTASANAPVFGAYQATGSGSGANGSVSVSCVVLGTLSQNVFYTVKLDLGSQAQGTQRRMQSGSNHLRYNLYCDGSFNSIWADGGSSTCTKSGGQASLLGTLLTVFPVYGNIPGGQFVASGSYTDSISVQVLY
jgi:spore coat protein U-like protein